MIIPDPSEFRVTMHVQKPDDHISHSQMQWGYKGFKITADYAHMLFLWVKMETAPVHKS